MTNSANGCRKDMFIFFVWPLIMLTSLSHCCFREKEMQIFIFLLLSCILYPRCSVRNLLPGRSKSIKKIYMKVYFQKQRLLLGKMCKKQCRK